MREYELTAFDKGDFQDPNGNFWCSGALKGVSEPVKFVVKDPTKFNVGDMLYGEIIEATSKAGKPYKRFKRAKKPEDNHSFSGGKREWQPRDDMAIRAQWAIGQALSKFPENCYQATDEDRMTLLHNIEHFAKEIYAMVDNVKGSVVTGSQKESEEEFASLVASAVDNGTEINLNDIPF